jgi:hypothetical protein
MKLLYRLLSILTISVSIFPVLLNAQSLSVGTPALEDYYRRSQLLGKIDSSLSFTSRPFFPREALKLTDIFDPENTLPKTRWNKWDGTFHFAKDKGYIQLLPVTLQVKYSNPVPISMNDGIMIPARGFQPLISAGFYAKLGPLSIHFQPEYLYAQNLLYQGFPQEHTESSWATYYSIYNYIDLPEQFGKGAYQKASWGQSSIRLTFGPVSFGLSNENLWWGPGMRNSLLMTNSAPGFKHLTLNTVRPIKTPIGSFEGQLVSGRLENSGFTPPIYQRDSLGYQWIIQKPNDWRYFNGLILSYQPKWVPGLFLGATRSFTIYHEDLNSSLSSILPVIIPITKKNLTGQSEESILRDQIASLFIRWLWVKESAEIYFEYGREDHAYNFRDLYLDLEHTRAYNLGFRKLLKLKNKPNEFIQVNVEATHLEANNHNRMGGSSSWYTHWGIVQGYTNQGQLLGAGIGPGSNLQTLNISWVKGLKLIGLQFERFVHNKDFQYRAFLDTRFNWADLIGSIIAEWNYKNLLFTAKIDGVSSYSYQFFYDPIPSNPPFFWDPAKNVYSIQALLGVMYRF